jgi:large subunit ribosomal protein L9
MDGMKLIIVRQAGEGGQLYGSVTARDVGDAIKQQGINIDRAQVLLNAPVKVLGTFKTSVRLHPEVKVDVEFTVARSMEEATMKISQAAALLERAEDAEKLAGETAAPDVEGEAVGEEEAAAANA